MGYPAWRKENEDKCLQILNTGDTVLPCFSHTAYCKFTDDVFGPLVEQIIKKPGMNPISFPAVFAEYLHEEYNVSPADLEIMCQAMYKMLFAKIDETAQLTASMVAQRLQQSSEDGEEDYDDDTD